MAALLMSTYLAVLLARVLATASVDQLSEMVLRLGARAE
jgi:hypothetical protein